MTGSTVLHIPVWSQNGVERLNSLLKSYVKRYESTDVGTLVLLAEGLGPDFVKPYISDTWIRGFFRASAQNPVFLLYIPLLITIEPSIERQAENIYDEIKVIETHEKVRNVIERHVLIERKVTLVSLALASKHVLYMDLEKHKGYIEFFTDTLNIIADVMMRHHDDLDPVEKASLLCIYEVLNTLRSKLGKTLLDISWLRSDLDKITRAELQLFSRVAVAPLLYDIYKIKKDREYLIRFYEIISDVDPEALYKTLMEEESRSIKILKEYYQLLDEESISALSTPLSEVEFALISRLVKIIQDDFVRVPEVGFSDFVSEYYSIPKKLLKMWLRIALIQKYIIAHLSTIMLSSIIVAILSAIFWILLSAVSGLLLGIPIGGFVSVVVKGLFKRVQSSAEMRIFEWFKRKEENAKKKAKELEYRIKYFNHFVPCSSGA